MTTEPAHIKAEAARLKAIFQERKKTDKTLTQDRIADECGWSGQSVVSQYFNGRIPLNVAALIKFASLLNFRPSEVSPRLAKENPHLEGLFASEQTQAVAEERASYHVADPATGSGSFLLHTLELWDDETPLGPDEVELPFYKEVELSAGPGSAVALETKGRKLRFGKRTLARKGIDPKNAACATVTGNSMEPVLPNGSTVGVDVSQTRIVDGQMYAIDHAGQLRVKILYRLPDGGMRIRSFNADEHPDERYDAVYVAENIKIIGKVFWYSVLV